jgi:hypothetical protein
VTLTTKQEKEVRLKYLWDEHARLMAALVWAENDLKRRGLDPHGSYIVPKDGSVDPVRTALSAIQADLSINVGHLTTALGSKPRGVRCQYCLVRPATHFYGGADMGPRFGVMGQSGCADPACDKSRDVWGMSTGYTFRQPYYWVTLTSKFGRSREQRVNEKATEVLHKGRWVKARWNPRSVSRGGVFYPAHWEPTRR